MMRQDVDFVWAQPKESEASKRAMKKEMNTWKTDTSKNISIVKEFPVFMKPFFLQYSV